MNVVGKRLRIQPVAAQPDERAIHVGRHLADHLAIVDVRFEASGRKKTLSAGLFGEIDHSVQSSPTGLQ